HVGHRGFDIEEVTELAAAITRLAVRRPGVADATDIDRDDQLPLTGQALIGSEFQTIGLLASFVHAKCGAQWPAGCVRNEYPNRNVDTRFGNELDFFDLVAFALSSYQMFRSKRSVGLPEPE